MRSSDLPLEQGYRIWVTAPSPARCARHLSPAKQGRGNAGRGLAPFLAPMKWGRGGERSEPVRGTRIRLKTQMRLPCPLEGEMSGRTEGGAKECSLAARLDKPNSAAVGKPQLFCCCAIMNRLVQRVPERQ